MLSDNYLFPALQISLVLFVLVIARLDARRRAREPGNFEASLTRGEKSMGKFYAAYGGLTTIFVTLSVSVSVDYARTHRTFFTVLDILLIAYARLWNAWFRNKLIGWTNALNKREH